MKHYKKRPFDRIDLVDRAERARLVAQLRGKASDLDRTYQTVRYGTVPSFRGCCVEGDYLYIGHPSEGTAEILYKSGWLECIPLTEVKTERLAVICRGTRL